MVMIRFSLSSLSFWLLLFTIASCTRTMAQSTINGKYDNTTRTFMPEDTSYKVTYFTDGHAIATKDSKHNVIDTAGNIIRIDQKKNTPFVSHLSKNILQMVLSLPTNQGVNSTCNGYEGGTYVICDLKGNLIIPAILTSTQFQISNGEADHLIYFYDAGSVPFNNSKYRARSMKCVMCNSCLGRMGIIDTTGNIIVGLGKYFEIGEFQNGLANVSNDSLEGYINMKGEEVIPCQFDNAKKFNQGIATVELNKKFGAIDTIGKIVIPIIYENEFKFSDDKAWVFLNGKGFYIDKYGNKLE